MTARHAQHKTKQGGDQHADGQDVKRRVGLGRDHPVIHLHGKDNAGEGEQVDEQGCQHHPAVRAQVAHHQPVEPVRAVFRDVGIHAAVLQRGQRAQGNNVADGGQQRAHRQTVGMHLVVEKADVQRVFPVEAVDHADFAVVQCHHHRQTPAVDRLPIGREQLERQPGFPGKLRQGRYHRFAFQPGGARNQRSGRAGDAVARGNKAKRLRPLRQRLIRHCFFLRDFALLHGWISTVWMVRLSRSNA